MLQELLTKENLTLAGVAVLFLWKIIESVIKLYKKEASQTDNMAFDLAKTKLSNSRNSYDFPLLTYFFMYRDVLKKKMRFPEGYVNWLSHREEKVDMQIQELQFKLRAVDELPNGSVILPTWRSLYYEARFLLRQIFSKKRMTTKRVIIQNKSGEKLTGLRDMPTRKMQKYPTVILVHGFGAEKTESGMFDDIARRLASSSYQVFRFDFVGLGESEGSYTHTTLTRQSEDLRSILDYVLTDPLTDVHRIGLVGMSLGTAVITALQPKEIQALIYLGSVSEPHKTLEELFGSGYSAESISTRVTSEGRKVEVWSEFWKDFDRYDLPNLIKNINAPILFVHGEKDSKVGVESAEKYFANANSLKELKVVKNADHGFYQGDERSEMVGLVEGWFDKYLLR